MLTYQINLTSDGGLGAAEISLITTPRFYRPLFILTRERTRAKLQSLGSIPRLSVIIGWWELKKHYFRSGHPDAEKLSLHDVCVFVDADRIYPPVAKAFSRLIDFVIGV